jgi:acetyl esterase/lipase
MASAEIEQVLQYLDKHRPAQRSLEGARAYLEAMVAMEPPPADVAVEEITVGGVRAERLVPPGADPTRALLYLHGGGYALGSAKAYRPFTARVAHEFGGPTVVINYRLAPEHPFPAGLEDAVAAIRALSAERGGEQLVLCGDSAGGGLALAAMISLRDQGHPLPAAAALLSPWVDLDGAAEPNAMRAALDPIITPEAVTNLGSMYVGQGDKKNPLVSPTYANLTGLPPLLVHMGTRELQYDDALAFVEKARGAGVSVDLQIWDEMLHVFQLFPVLPESRRALAGIAAFLRKQVA